MVHVFCMIFRRDLRVYDNAAFGCCLARATEQAKKLGHLVVLLPVFFYRVDQTDPERNAYFSKHAFDMLNASVDDLDAQLCAMRAPSASMMVRRLRRIEISVPLSSHSSVDTHAEAEATALNRACREEEEQTRSNNKASPSSSPPRLHVFFNRDVTPYARRRDSALERALLMEEGKKRKGRTTSTTTEVQGRFEDYTLFAMDDPLTKSGSGSFYTVFKFLYNKRRELHERVPRDTSSSSSSAATKMPTDATPPSPRQAALHILHAIASGAFDDYESTRNDLARDVSDTSTTRLSKFLKFGNVSIREAYWAAYEAARKRPRRFRDGTDHPLIRELYFREFYYIVAWFRPDVLRGMTETNDKNAAFHADLDANIQWTDVSSGKGAHLLEAWKQGRTGVPIVDAGMRQLLHSGFMHNRCRMITAMFLTKDLLVDWREGERHFARHLVDYDPVQNNAGWQWSASVGNDAAPYFRIFNPYVQQARFDPDAVFTSHWVPELGALLRRANANGRLLAKWEDPRVRAFLRDRAGNAHTTSDDSPPEYLDPIIVSHKQATDIAKRAYFSAASRREI